MTPEAALVQLGTAKLPSTITADGLAEITGRKVGDCASFLESKAQSKLVVAEATNGEKMRNRSGNVVYRIDRKAAMNLAKMLAEKAAK